MFKETIVDEDLFYMLRKNRKIRKSKRLNKDSTGREENAQTNQTSVRKQLPPSTADVTT